MINSDTIISNSEYKVMEVIWASPNILSREIINTLEKNSSWTEATIKTLLNRLIKKEAIGYTKTGRKHVYYPIIKKEAYINLENKSFLDKFYKGSINNLLLHFLDSEEMTEKKVDELKKILMEKE